MPYANPTLFIDPKMAYPAGDHHLPFTDYIAQCKKIIKNTRVDLNSNEEKIIEANAPFELRPLKNQKIRYGALLIHGLLDSPFQMRDIGHHLQSQGMLVRAILLPGHGTVPGALLNVDYHTWLQSVQYGFSTLVQEVEEIFLVGNSTGAALALYHALTDATKVAGIIMLSPALRIHSVFAFLASYPRKTKWAWFHLDPQETIDYVKYSSLAFNPIYQVYQLARDINQSFPNEKLPCPLFFALSKNDEIICPNTVIKYFTRHSNPQSRMVLYTARPAMTYTDERITLRNCIYPQWRIRHTSHICVPIAPFNPHYGNQGDFPYASHTDHSNTIIFGEYTPYKTRLNALLCHYGVMKQRYQRLTFNPDFGFLMEAINKFIP